MYMQIKWEFQFGSLTQWNQLVFLEQSYRVRVLAITQNLSSVSVAAEACLSIRPFASWAKYV